MNLPACQMPGCRQTVPNGYTVCDPHGSELGRHLAAVVGMEDALDDALAKGQKFSVARRGTSARGTDEAPIPIRPEVADAARALRAGLIEACNWIAKAHGLIPPNSTARAGELARWLLYEIPWIRRQHKGPAMAARLQDVILTAARAMDRPADLAYLGPCEAINESGISCSEDLYAPHGAAIVRCWECAATYDIPELRERRLAQAEDKLGTPTEIAGAIAGFGVRVTPDALQKWRSRGLIAVRGFNALGRPKYRVGDVLKLAYASQVRRENGARRRGRRAQRDEAVPS